MIWLVVRRVVLRMLRGVDGIVFRRFHIALLVSVSSVVFCWAVVTVLLGRCAAALVNVRTMFRLTKAGLVAHGRLHSVTFMISRRIRRGHLLRTAMIDRGVDRARPDMRVTVAADVASARVCIDDGKGIAMSGDGIAARRVEGKCLMVCL